MITNFLGFVIQYLVLKVYSYQKRASLLYENKISAARQKKSETIRNSKIENYRGAGRERIQGNQEIVENVEDFAYPLKIVVVVEDDIITVVTNYPLKKGKKDESILR